MTAVALALFAVIELRSPHPMLPFSLFRSRQFTGANLTTLAVYAALGGAFFLLVLMLQLVLHYRPVPSGAALVPDHADRDGALGPGREVECRTGPRLPMTLGPIVMAAGFVLLGRMAPHSGYLTGVLPGVVLLGLRARPRRRAAHLGRARHC